MAVIVIETAGNYSIYGVCGFQECGGAGSGASVVACVENGAGNIRTGGKKKFFRFLFCVAGKEKTCFAEGEF